MLKKKKSKQENRKSCQNIDARYQQLKYRCCRPVRCLQLVLIKLAQRFHRLSERKRVWLKLVWMETKTSEDTVRDHYFKAEVCDAFPAVMAAV